jgi:tRNA(fMet)-specific endonuclease VapC
MRLLDTDVCVEILRKNRRVLDRRRETLDEAATTWVTAAELYYGAAKSAYPDVNGQAVSAFLRTLAVLQVGQPAAERFGALKARLEREGRQLADADLFIGAICLALGAVLVTGNKRHYERIEGLRMEDWIR